jgi:hypothetical protein
MLCSAVVPVGGVALIAKLTEPVPAGTCMVPVTPLVVGTVTDCADVSESVPDAGADVGAAVGAVVGVTGMGLLLLPPPHAASVSSANALAHVVRDRNMKWLRIRSSP